MPNLDLRRNFAFALPRSNETTHWATYVTSVFPVDVWANCLGDVSFSDSILDRLIHRAWRLNLEGPSMRSRTECGALEDPYGKKLKTKGERLSDRSLSNLEFD